MNAAVVLKSMAGQPWQEPRDSSWSTLVATAITLLALLVVWLSVSHGWPLVGAEFASPPGGLGPPVEAPAPVRREPARQPIKLTYYVVASETQKSEAHRLQALAAMEEAHGISEGPVGESLVRMVASSDEYTKLEHELYLATDAWSRQWCTVSVIDLR